MPTNKRILVVDDEASIRLLIVRILTRRGYDVVEAEDGEVALVKLGEGSYDAIVLDLMMPRIDGFGVLDHLITNSPEMIAKTVVATAFPRAAIRERLHHVVHVISKPFEVSLLLSSIETCIAS